MSVRERLRQSLLSIAPSSAGAGWMVSAAARSAHNLVGRPLAGAAERAQRAAAAERLQRAAAAPAPPNATAAEASPLPPIALYMRSDMPRESTAQLRAMLTAAGVVFHEVDVRNDEPSLQFLERRLRQSAALLPLVFVADSCLGGLRELQQLADAGTLHALLRGLA